MDLLSQQKDGLGGEIEHITQTNQQDLTQLTQKIAALKTRNQELEGVLATAEEKLGKKNINVSSLMDEQNRLQASLLLMKKENASLKQEVASLEAKLSDLKTN